MPLTLALAQNAAIPIQAFALQHLLTHMAMPTVMPAHHTLDPFACPTGPNRWPEPLIHLSLDVVPLGAKPITEHVFHRAHGTQPAHLCILRLLEPPAETPQPRQ